MAGSGADSFVQPLGFLLGLTAILALLLSYLGQSTIVAFIAVGAIVNAVGVEPDPTTLSHISEVGILILLFTAGLEVDLAAFAKNWRTAAIVGIGQIACCSGLFAALSVVVLPAIGTEFTADAAVYFGLCGCFSSTILVLGHLKHSKSMGTLHGQLCLGTLVLQDAASVLGIAVLGGIEKEGDGGSGGGGVAVPVLILFGKLLCAIFVCALLERYVLPRMFEAFARSLELLYLGSLGYATGLAALAVTAGFSGEITAFLAGVSISRLPYKMHIETKMEPIKSLGVAIFFISLGLGLDLGSEMVHALPWGFGLALFKMFATLPLFALLGVLAKLKSHTVFMLGLLMNQISEFSLILCTLCVRAHVFEPVVLTVLTVAAVVSIIASSVCHAHVDGIYLKMQRWACLRCIDDRRNRKMVKKLTISRTVAESTSGEDGVDVEAAVPVGAGSDLESPVGLRKAPSLLRDRPSGLGTDEDWAFEDQLKDRPSEQLKIDLERTEKELEEARESMAATADEKRKRPKLDDSAGSKRRLYTRASARNVKSPRSIVAASHATDIMHGMIEGYVVVDHQLLFCTLRAGRMLFWADSHDVGHAPPKSVWDVSGMAVLEARGDGVNAISGGKSEDLGLDIDDDDDVANEGLGIYEWTIVLGHIHRHTATSSIEDDSMKLAIHGLKDHSDHDGQDWHDALAVASSTLNFIALRLAHIREELHFRRDMEGGTPARGGLERRTASHSHRNEIICIGYNEMFPAVLALADAVGKEVVVVEYDPMKLNAIEKLYSEEKRRMDAFKKSKTRSSRNSLRDLQEAYTTDDIGRPKGLEKGSTPPRPRPRRVRTMSTPVLQQSVDPNQFFWASHSSSSDNLQGLGKGGGKGLKGEVKGVKCEYADVHDPECWEELEMDQAFMLVCTIKGARHAEKAMLDWLRRRESDAIFVACTQNNVEAMQMYKAGAHFVMQTDALAMRSTRDIFLETVANFGDCSQLKAAGLSHMKRLKKLEEEDKLKWLYETG